MIPADTSVEASVVQFEVLRRIGLAGRTRLTFALIDDATELAHAGIRVREPNVSDDRLRWLLMGRRYGRGVAEAVLGAEPQRR